MQDELDDYSIFDTSEVDWTVLRTKDSRRITLVAKSETPINAIKLYWALKTQVELWQIELGIMDEPPEVQ